MTRTRTSESMKFVVVTEFGELLDVAMWLSQVEGHEVVLCVQDSQYAHVGEGLVARDRSWWRYLGQGRVWVVDGAVNGSFQDWLRSEGEAVFGGCEAGDRMENDRQLNQALFRSAGFDQPESRNFRSVEDAVDFVLDHQDVRWILKQNGSAPKSINHLGHFPDNEDMLFHLRQLKSSWSVPEWGPVDFDLMEVIEGVEVAVTGFWNGHDWLRDAGGRVVGFVNFEEKKETAGGAGETTGETGTAFVPVTGDHHVMREILLRPELEAWLAASGFRGCFDVNCIWTREGRVVALEPTCRPGIPTASYVLLEAFLDGAGRMLDQVARGGDDPVRVKQGVGMVLVVTAKPYPVESDVDESATSVGERLWLQRDGRLSDPMLDDDQLRRVHLENFMLAEDSETGEPYLKVATKSGYLLTVTGNGPDIPSVREDILEYIKDTLYLSGMKYRTDIGERAEDFALEHALVGSMAPGRAASGGTQ